jgi:hypothetical protein
VQSSEHLTWQIVLYILIAAMYLGAAVSILLTSSKPRQWLGFCFLLTYLENVVAFPAALFGYERHAWMLGLPDTTRYLSIVLVAMCSTMAALFLFTKSKGLPRFLDRFPQLTISNSRLHVVAVLLSVFAALASIAMSASGHSGYFIAVSETYAPPFWLGLAGEFVNVGTGLCFIVLLSAQTTYGRIRMPEWLLVFLWVFAGLLSGLKTLVVLPFFFVVVAVWLAGRLRVVQCLAFAGAFMLAYGVVEPLREVRLGANHDNALEGLRMLVSEGQLAIPEVGDVLDRVLSRVDYSETAVVALEADRNGQLEHYRERLRQVYVLIPALAFIPAALWPGKPLADLGRELSISLGGVESSAVTPSTVVASYLWLGFTGVVLNGIIAGYCFVIAGRLLMRYLHRPLAYIPAMLLVLTFSVPESIRAYGYISIIRTLVAVALFYAVARALGLTARPGVEHPVRTGWVSQL